MFGAWIKNFPPWPMLPESVQTQQRPRYKSRSVFVDLPDGGRRPFCDPYDVAYMMWTSPALALCLLNLCPKKKEEKPWPLSFCFWRLSFWKNSTFVCVSLRLNITSHLSSDISHIIILKHISALARTLCDTLKMIATWANKTTGENTAFYRGRNEFVAVGFLDDW